MNYEQKIRDLKKEIFIRNKGLYKNLVNLYNEALEIEKLIQESNSIHKESKELHTFNYLTQSTWTSFTGTALFSRINAYEMDTELTDIVEGEK